MLDWTLLLGFVSFGLLGSLHCAGMCGGFALAVAGRSRKQALGLLSHQWSYILGKALTYAILAMLLASASHWVATGAHGAELRSSVALARLGTWMARAIGASLIAMGLYQWGWRPAWLKAPGRLLQFALAPARSVFTSLRDLPGWSGSFGMGMLTGLLPCGMSWAAFLLATQTDPLSAFVGAFGFGLATAPTLLAVGLGAHWINARWQRAAPKLLGSALMLFGVITWMRGSGALLDCCL